MAAGRSEKCGPCPPGRCSGVNRADRPAWRSCAADSAAVLSGFHYQPQPSQRFDAHAMRYFAIVYVILLSLASLLPSGADTPYVGGWDADISPTFQDFAHIPAYMILTLLALNTIPTRNARTKTRSALLIAAVCIAFGVVIEWLQAHFIPGRTGSVSDALLNSLGAVLAVAFHCTIQSRCVPAHWR